MKHVLVTGASGFIGRALCKRMQAEGWYVRGIVRSTSQSNILPPGLDAVTIESIGPKTDWSKVLASIDTVVHLAARVHVMYDRARGSLSEYRQVNVMGTERLARMAVAQKIRRFIFMSSVKVNGEGRSEAYTESDDPSPQDPYSISKWEAEQVLKEIGTDTGMEVVILRSPLVYGPGVKANFLQLLKLVDSGFPLPFAKVKNQRSLIYLENLVDAIVSCIKHGKSVAGQTYLVGDGEAVSTAELIRRISLALGRKARLLPLPLSFMRYGAKLLGKTAAVDRLLESLTVDMTKIRQELNWDPPYSMEQGLRETTRWFKTRLSLN